MLASWLRMKYPNVFQGAHAASAPILFYPETVSPYAFNQIVTEDYRLADPTCPPRIQEGLQTLQAARDDKTKYASIKKAFNTCDDIADADQVDQLVNRVQGCFGGMAMVDYPYPATFEGSLPGFPVKVSCGYYSALKKGYTTEELWAASAEAANVADNW